MRLKRSEYWVVLGAMTVSAYAQTFSSAAWLLPIVVLMVLRLRDAGRSGWLVVAPLALMAAAFGAGVFFGAQANVGQGGDGPALMGLIIGAAAGVLGLFAFAAWTGSLPTKAEARETAR